MQLVLQPDTADDDLVEQFAAIGEVNANWQRRPAAIALEIEGRWFSLGRQDGGLPGFKDYQ